MSHFVVMVTNTDNETLEEQLEPFYEQGNEDDYFMEKEYFVERNKESVEKWLEKAIELEAKDIENCEKEIEKSKEDKKLVKHMRNRIKWCKKIMRNWQRIQSLKTLTGKLNAIHRYEGCAMDKDGLYWVSNPNAKWDWWVEGGRWDGWLVKKNGERCNRCLVKELDFEGMRKAELEDRAKWYDEEIEKAKEDDRKPFFFGFKETPTKEEYVNRKVWLSPYAVLHEGEWIEKGEMGWWGIDDPHYTEEDWDKKFQEFFKTLDPETEIAIVDCHI